MNYKFYLFLVCINLNLCAVFANVNNSSEFEINSEGLMQIDSLNGLLYDSFFFDQVLAYSPFFYDLHDKFDRNIVSLMWGKSYTTNIIFDGVPLNSIIHGDFDFFRLPYTLSQTINASAINTMNYAGASSLTGSIAMRTLRESTNFGKLNVQGGNANGSSYFQYNSGSKNIFWNLSGNFFITNGHSISANKPDTIDILRQNSKSRHESIFGKIGIRDDNSVLMLSLFWSGLTRQINSNIFHDTLRLNETSGGLVLINLEFESNLNPIVELTGNIYYKGSNREINFHAEVTSPDFINDVKEDEYTIGANLTTNLKLIDELQSKVHLSYKRDIASLSKLSQNLTSYSRFTSEMINTKLVISRHLSNSIEATSYLEYAIYHPILSANTTLLDDLATFNTYFALRTKLFDEFFWVNSVFFGKQLPPLNLMNSDFADNESYVSYGMETGKSFSSALFWKLNQSNFKLFYQFCKFDDNFMPVFADAGEMTMNRENLTIHGIGFDLNTQFGNFYLKISGDHKLNDNDEPLLLIRPKSKFFSSLAYKMNFGAMIVLEAIFIGANKDYDSIRREIVNLDNHTEINIRLGMLVFKNNEAFFRVNNVTDSYHQKSWGNPTKGRHFILGINLNF